MYDVMFGDALVLFLALIFSQSLDARTSATLAHINPALFALGDEPAATAKIFHNASVHHFFVKATKKAVERFTIAQFDRQANHPLSRAVYIPAKCQAQKGLGNNNVPSKL
jgi:hypothetical protein